METKQTIESIPLKEKVEKMTPLSSLIGVKYVKGRAGTVSITTKDKKKISKKVVLTDRQQRTKATLSQLTDLTLQWGIDAVQLVKSETIKQEMNHMTRYVVDTLYEDGKINYEKVEKVGGENILTPIADLKSKLTGHTKKSKFYLIAGISVIGALQETREMEIVPHIDGMDMSGNLYVCGRLHGIDIVCDPYKIFDDTSITIGYYTPGEQGKYLVMKKDLDLSVDMDDATSTSIYGDVFGDIVEIGKSKKINVLTSQPLFKVNNYI